MTCNYYETSHKQNVGLISIHPAPYRDITFATINRKNNHNLQILTMFQKDDGHAYWNLEKAEYPTIYLGKGFQFRGSYFHFRFFTLITKNSFDVLVIPGYFHLTSLIAIIYCIIKHKPFIYTADTVSSLMCFKANNLIRDILTNWIINHAAAFWIPGNATKQFLISKGVDPVKIFEGCYCLDTDSIVTQTLKTKALRNDFRKRLGIAPDDFVFLMVGNMIPNRQHTKLINAFKIVESTNKKAFLILLGEGSEQESIHAMVKKLDCFNVRIAAPVAYDQLPQWYTSSDAYVHSGYEPYSTALEFAAKSGLPIITTDVVGAAFDYVHHELSGYLLQYADNKELSDTMLNLSLNPDLALKMGQAALNIALKRTPEWAAEQFEAAVNHARKYLYK